MQIFGQIVTFKARNHTHVLINIWISFSFWIFFICNRWSRWSRWFIRRDWFASQYELSTVSFWVTFWICASIFLSIKNFKYFQFAIVFQKCWPSKFIESTTRNEWSVCKTRLGTWFEPEIHWNFIETSRFIATIEWRVSMTMRK